LEQREVGRNLSDGLYLLRGGKRRGKHPYLKRPNKQELKKSSDDR